MTRNLFPIYIVSKGRWKKPYTAESLEFMNTPYYIIVEKEEYDKYATKIDENKILILPKEYQDEYDTYDRLGNTKSKGPGEHVTLPGITAHKKDTITIG